MAKDVVVRDDEFPQLKQYTRKEVEQVEEKLFRSAVEIRHWLLDLFLHGAHKAFNYVAFDEYATERLSMDITKQNAFRLRQWAKVEIDTLNHVDELVDGSSPVGLLDAVSKHPLSRSVALELAKLPSPVRRDAYLEAIALGSTGKGELQCIKHIVTRRLNEANGVVHVVPDPRPPRAPKAPSTAKASESVEPSPPVATTIPTVAVVVVEEPKTADPSPATVPAMTVTVAAVTTPKRGAEPEVVAPEDHPWSQWEESLLSVLTWVQNRKIDAEPSYRKESSGDLVRIACWVTQVEN